MHIETINPATGQPITTYKRLDKTQVTRAIEHAHKEFQTWRRTSFAKRTRLMRQLAQVIRSNKHAYATVMAQEMGKPIQAGVAEIEKCAWVCEYYAEHAEAYLTPKPITADWHKSYVCYEPLGIIFAIMPWNFPFWQVFRFAAPHIMAGNVGLLKHASVTPGCGNAIIEAFCEAGFPQYVLQHLVMDAEFASDVIAHPHVTAVTLTGSEQAGKIVAAMAGAHVKKAVLELGGSDAYLVLADADIDLAAQTIVASRLINNGQSCIAAKRIIVVEEIVEPLLVKMKAVMQQYTLGDPLDPATQLGPMARADLREQLHQQVLTSVNAGAKLSLGGQIPAGPGFYYPPTILTDVTPGMPAFDEEMFGPVAAVIPVKQEKDAIALANQSRYGLGAAVFTRDEARGEYIARYELEAGSCFVNTLVVSDPRAPFGGIKYSGFGRELAREGILEFMNTKTIAIK